jgi:repressor LexA
MPRPISQRQRLILSFINQHIEDHGYPPTVREIGEAVNLSSSSTVHAHLKALEEKGMIQRDAVLTRAIKIVGSTSDGYTRKTHTTHPVSPGLTMETTGGSRFLSNVVQVPIVGTVAAGRPLLAHEDIEEYFPLPSDFVGGDGFILKVRGDSMIDDGIYEGDYVVVRRQQTATNGDTVVAMIDSEATVKRFYKEARRIRLQPANQSMDPIYADSAEVLGKVVGVVRRMN